MDQIEASAIQIREAIVDLTEAVEKHTKIISEACERQRYVLSSLLLRTPTTKNRLIVSITESHWERGQGEETVLLTEAGQYSALGFYLRACWVADEALREEPSPSTLLKKRLPQQAAWLVEEYERSEGITVRRDSRDALRLREANDSAELTEEERKKQIRDLFATHGVQVVFID